MRVDFPSPGGSSPLRKTLLGLSPHVPRFVDRARGPLREAGARAERRRAHELRGLPGPDQRAAVLRRPGGVGAGGGGGGRRAPRASRCFPAGSSIPLLGAPPSTKGLDRYGPFQNTPLSRSLGGAEAAAHGAEPAPGAAPGLRLPELAGGLRAHGPATPNSPAGVSPVLPPGGFRPEGAQAALFRDFMACGPWDDHVP